MSLVKAFEWRYATKLYDTSRQPENDEVDDLLRAVQLAPSSYGSQPYQLEKQPMSDKNQF